MTDQQLTDPKCNCQYHEVTVQFSFASFLSANPLIFICIGFNLKFTKIQRKNKKSYYNDY